MDTLVRRRDPQELEVWLAIGGYLAGYSGHTRLAYQHDLPQFVGDWDGDGIDEIGLHRESTGFFYWRNSLTTGIADGEVFFGDPGDRFVAGDWGIVDGKHTPAVFRPADVTFYFRHTLTQGIADSQFTWLGAGTDWLPVSRAR